MRIARSAAALVIIMPLLLVSTSLAALAGAKPPIFRMQRSPGSELPGSVVTLRSVDPCPRRGPVKSWDVVAYLWAAPPGLPIAKAIVPIGRDRSWATTLTVPADASPGRHLLTAVCLQGAKTRLSDGSYRRFLDVLAP
jgi:hypothetical protein